jgi:hypothetical protein
MPGKELIREQLLALPIKLLGSEADDGFIWEHTERGVHMKVTKEAMQFPAGHTHYYLTLSGDRKNMRNVKRDFKRFLGEPEDEDWVTAVPGLYAMAWDAQKIDLMIQSKNSAE